MKPIVWVVNTDKKMVFNTEKKKAFKSSQLETKHALEELLLDLETLRILKLWQWGNTVFN